eukprot:4384762-Pyramimonas_sp.AAC.1
MSEAEEEQSRADPHGAPVKQPTTSPQILDCTLRGFLRNQTTTDASLSQAHSTDCTGRWAPL